MEMAVNIITIVDRYNYGNRLQNYALAESLKALGFEHVRTIRVVDSRPRSYLRDMRRAYRGGKQGRGAAQRSFDQFTKAFIPFKKTKGKDLAGIPGLFVIGSDQVWNPSWDIGASLDGAQFALQVPGARKAAYAASFGIELGALPEETRELFREGLLSFDESMLSVREDEGAAIVENLTGWKVPAVVDPTILLDSAAWRARARVPHIDGIKKEPFCVKYFLGDERAQQEVERLSAANGLNVVDILAPNVEIGPLEFVWLIDHASMVFTDSFHAAVFSLLFHTPCRVLERTQKGQCDMASRFRTLAAVAGLDDIGFADCRLLEEYAYRFKWDEIDVRLDEHRRGSLDWLQRTMGFLAGTSARLVQSHPTRREL
ncbi:polysaccharide pyruvyl transferase family protein [Adlercreutzia murintestinalis]|jgi:Polysaccharide pyruvyl transferase.|uniref:polysaccharide pyruvyl transferase family protein n=1 Tax=Adlercreutzia murintestinalis TaxID=2941325 RepID=UPI0020419DE8|nr:polysaccharide pyruvyl transferase family protein [Adlercreutzia murintestinalis]